jgi:hypothetical protein
MSGRIIKLDAQEKYVTTAAIKAMYASTPEDDKSTRFAYADILQRIEHDAIDIRAKTFLFNLADKVLDHTEKLMASGSINEDAIVRASTVKEIYARIKEKTNEQSK